MPASIVDRVLAAAHAAPDRELLVQGDLRVTAGRFAARVDRFGSALDRAGVRAGDRVAIVPTIGVDTIAIRYAALRLGCVVALCPNTGVAGRLAGFVERMRADALVVFPETASAAGEVECALRLSVGAVDGATDLDLAAAGASPPTGADGEVLVTSGGTSGDSKTSRRSLVGWTRVVDVGPVADRRLLVCTSLAYVAQVLCDQVLMGGGTVVLCERFDPPAVLDAIERERVTHVGLVEPLLVELIHHPDFAHRDVRSLRAVSHIGADAAPNLRRRLLERAGEILVHPYGASEVGIASVLAPPEYSLARPELLSTVGRPLPSVDVRIVTPTGAPVTPGDTGVVSIASGQVSDGYATPVAGSGFRDGRFLTGDLGRIDPDGYLHLRGRAMDRREIGGEPVMPVDVQEAICRHPEVRYAVAVPGPDVGFGAAVLLATGSEMTASQLRAFISDHAHPRLVPDPLVVLDRIPVTEQGKPDRSALTRRLSVTGGRT